MVINNTNRNRPFWVKLGLWGLPNRRSALAFFWLSLFIAAGCAIAGFWDARFFLGTLVLFSAFWYWLAIRWVDQFGNWER